MPNNPEQIAKSLYREGVIDYAIDTIDDLCLEGKFDTLNKIFEAITEDMMSGSTSNVSISLSLLTTTRGAQDRLPARERFIKRLKAQLREDGMEAVNSYLDGLQ